MAHLVREHRLCCSCLREVEESCQVADADRNCHNQVVEADLLLVEYRNQTVEVSLHLVDHQTQTVVEDLYPVGLRNPIVEVNWDSVDQN